MTLLFELGAWVTVCLIAAAIIGPSIKWGMHCWSSCFVIAVASVSSRTPLPALQPKQAVMRFSGIGPT